MKRAVQLLRARAPGLVRASIRLPLVARAFLLVVVAPTLLAALYYGLIASDVYVAEVRFTVRSTSPAPASGIIDAVLGGAGSGSSREDAGIVRDYILSPDMLDRLDARMDLRTHYESNSVDWPARLSTDASAEDYLKYYRGMITVRLDQSSNITTVKARAFEPRTARTLAANLLKLSEDLVNQMSARIAEDTVRFARAELRKSENRVRKAALALTSYRTKSRSVNPGEETSAVLGIVTRLEGQLAGARADLAEAESFMRPNSARVRNLRRRVTALRTQVAKERGRLADGKGSDLTRVIYGYEPLALDQKLAEQQYQSVLASLEVARTEAQRKQRYLIAFVQPKLPDEAMEPRRAWNTLLVFVAACLVFGIGALIWSAVKEHVRF